MAVTLWVRGGCRSRPATIGLPPRNPRVRLSIRRPFSNRARAARAVGPGFVMVVLLALPWGTAAAEPDTPRGSPSAADLGPLPAPAVYQRLVDPAEYPAYRRRSFRAPTWKTFDDRPQLVGWRAGVRDNVTRQLIDELPDPDRPVTGRNWFVGRVLQPNILFAQREPADFARDTQRKKDLGIYVFNVGGYGPGAAVRGGYGQVPVAADRRDLLSRVLGDHWLGFDLGEQDGRYHNGFEGRQLPAPRTAVGQHKLFRDWCDRVVADQGDRLSLLSVLWGWHYPTQDGTMTLIGAESEDKFGITNPQVQYAFLRGAGKQYGVLWFGNVATFGTFAGASTWSFDEAGKFVFHPGGGSGNLMRRLFLQQWLWNCSILSYERAALAGPTGRQGTPMDKTPARVSPIGRVQLATERLIRSGFTPGVMQTPVAILQDYFSGWMPARTNIVQFQAFNGLPYRPGDHLTDALLSTIFPGYEDCGWYFDERGGLCPTPHGDIADCLLSDAAAEIIGRYGLVLVCGIEHDTAGVRDRLDHYLGSGGTAVVTGADAARLWPEHVSAETVQVPKDAMIRWARDGREDAEPDAFDLQVATLPAHAEVLASCAGRPAVARLSVGKGTLVLLLAANGMNRDPAPVPPMRSPVFGKGENTPLARPHRLLRHVAAAYDSALRSQRLFTAGAGLTVTSCRRDDGTWVVGVSNPRLESQPFEIVSHVGPIAAVQEVDLGCPIHEFPGYWPRRHGPADPYTESRREDLGELPGQLAPSDDRHIRGGDIRFFEVTLRTSTAVERSHEPPPKAVRGRLLAVPDLVTLRERLLAWPMFASCFDGVAIDARGLLDCDPTWLADQAAWLRRHAIRILVDARPADGERFTRVCERVAPLQGLVEVLVTDPPPTGDRDATGTPRLRGPADVRWLTAGTVPDGARGRVDVLEADWRSWDGVYADVKRAWLDARPGRIAGPGTGDHAAETPQSRRRPSAAAGRRFVALHGIGDLERAVAARPGLLAHFDGLLVDSDWLESRSDAAIDRDAAWLADRSLGTIVDFSRSINRFPDLTFSSGVPHQREESVRRMRAVLDKMQGLGCRAAVITSHEDGPTGSDWDDQRAGIESLLDEAAARGITVHWRTSNLRPPKKLDKHAALVADLRTRHDNLRIAACTVDEPDAARLAEAIRPAGSAEIWLVAAPPPRNQRGGVQFLPLTQLTADGRRGILAAAAGATVVFDAEYLSWDETLADVKAMGL